MIGHTESQKHMTTSFQMWKSGSESNVWNTGQNWNDHDQTDMWVYPKRKNENAVSECSKDWTKSVWWLWKVKLRWFEHVEHKWWYWLYYTLYNDGVDGITQRGCQDGVKEHVKSFRLSRQDVEFQESGGRRLRAQLANLGRSGNRLLNRCMHVIMSSWTH